MSMYEKLDALLPVVCPEFYCQRDIHGNTYVFLNEGRGGKTNILPEIQDKTQLEAIENHIHLFDGPFRKKDYELIKELSLRLAQNMFDKLTDAFPEKKFMLYLTMNNDSVIIRFHQRWDNEPPYYDLTDTYDAEIFAFK